MTSTPITPEHPSEPPTAVYPRVVLVDDQATLRTQLRLLLQETGLLVVAEATGGATALEAVRLTNPDVVVMDIRMPGMDGLEATRHLRTEHPTLPVIVYTADTSQTVQTLAAQAGAVAITYKGDPVDHLLTALRQATSGRWGRVERRHP